MGYFQDPNMCIPVPLQLSESYLKFYRNMIKLTDDLNDFLQIPQEVKRLLVVDGSLEVMPGNNI